MFQKIVKFLIIVGAASLIYFQPITEGGEFSLATIRYRSDFVFLAAVGLWVVSRVLGLIRSNQDTRARLTRRVFVWMWLFVMFTTIATLLSLVTYNLWFEILGLSSLVKIVLGLMLAQVVYENLRGDAIFYKWIARALYLSPALVLALGIIYLVNPSMLPSFLREQLALVSYGSRFQGLTSNPGNATLAPLVSLSFVWVMMLHNVVRGKLWAVSVQLLYCIGMTFLIFWSLTRGALITLIFTLGIGGFMTWYCLGGKKNLLGFPFFPAVITLVVTMIGWNVLPQELRGAFIDRFSEPDARLYIWQYYLDVAMSNPLGVGFNYEQMFAPLNPYNPGRLNPHNAWLSTLMYGGIGGLLSMMMSLVTILKLIRIELGKSREQVDMPVLYIGAATALLAMWVGYMFAGGVPLTEFTYSILLALVLAGGIRPSEIPARRVSIPKMHGLQIARTSYRERA